MKGWRTLILNGAIVVGTAGLQWAAGVSWVEYVGPTWSIVIVAGVNAVMRLVTTGPVGSGK